ncbi:AbgT family transporter [Natranaerobius trueperi]|uniref:Aminobenzoyl-glutamate transporter n=1 Tax=Natranaerobius trueperi TaxID=759412 RepID=A0A226BWM8_9FIRM|nr:AbgT family transporter [Natranaerobius trueperi]OWZ83406.1 aminobenzoyl-glutamate transporter [Natranaerobius trueperi]
MSKSTSKQGGLTHHMLNVIEQVGNRLPHPIVLFFILSIGVIFTSFFVSLLDVAVEHPATGELVEVENLLSREGFQSIVSEAVDNFTSFAALGVVIVAMLGVGVADETGLINSALKKLVLGASERYLTSVIVFAGIMSNLAADAGYVVVVPLGAMIFAAKGRHPLAGLAAAFAGVSGGFSANLLVTSVDPLLAGMTAEGAQILDPSYTIAPTANYYFMAVSTVLIVLLGTWVTEKIVTPRLGTYEGKFEGEMKQTTPEENKGLKSALTWLLIAIAVLLLLTVPSNGLLRADGELIGAGTPFMNGIVPIIAVLFFIPALAYGFKVGHIKSSNDIANSLSKGMKDMAGLIALFFVISQFIAYFEWSNMGTILAVNGAEFLESIGLTGLPLIILFVILIGFINLFMGGAATKWAIMSPIFVPMLMELNYSPEFVQLAYRIGDSATNIVAPLMTYFAVVIGFAKKYDEHAGIGTIIATMIPYAIAFKLGWIILLSIWFVLGLPIGPGDTIFLSM